MPKGSGRHLFGILNFQMLLSRLFVIPRTVAYWGTPGVVLAKTIETSPMTAKVKEIARKTGCTPEGLRKSFKAVADRTPSDYKRSETLHFARYWILETRVPFKTVATRIGFKTSSYFTRYIKRYTGMTPKAIRASRKWPS